MSFSKRNLFNRWAPFYDLPFTSVFYQAVHKRLLEFVELPEAGQVLDLGCGTGKLLKRLAKRHPQLMGTGLDFADDMLQQARQQSAAPDRLTYVQGGTDTIPLPDDQFDAAFCTISFLHYANAIEVLHEIHRVLKPGGQFYLADYTLPQWSGQTVLHVTQADVHFYSPTGRETLAQETGFQVEGHHYLLGPVLLTVFRAEA